MRYWFLVVVAIVLPLFLNGLNFADVLNLTTGTSRKPPSLLIRANMTPLAWTSQRHRDKVGAAGLPFHRPLLCWRISPSDRDAQEEGIPPALRQLMKCFPVPVFFL